MTSVPFWALRSALPMHMGGVVFVDVFDFTGASLEWAESRFSAMED